MCSLSDRPMSRRSRQRWAHRWAATGSLIPQSAVSVVEQIPRHASTGKLKRFIALNS